MKILVSEHPKIFFYVLPKSYLVGPGQKQGWTNLKEILSGKKNKMHPTSL